MVYSHQPATVYSIPSDVPFLKTLVDHVLDGTLLPDDFDRSDPLALSKLSIYLPTQRSVRLLEEAFLAAAGTPTVVLPRIRALGDVDEDELLLQVDDLNRPAGVVPPAMPPLLRQLMLAKLVLRWGASMAGKATPVKSESQPLLVPASPADAAWLAADLGDLLDRAATEGVAWDGLAQLVPDDYASFWQLNLTFLKIVTEAWPKVLNATGMVDAATRRDLLIAAEQERLKTLAGPVIAAGSTGTLPSTARFLAAVAHLPKGALILPGFDRDLAPEAYAAIGGPYERKTAQSGHPQYGLKQLLENHVKIAPDAVHLIGRRDHALARRSMVLSATMLPAPMTDRWPNLRHAMDDADLATAFENVALVNAKTDGEEALAIACALREFVEQGDGFACLVTPDRTLARRVALELGRWGLDVDDSAGRPLIKTAPVILAELLAGCVATKFDPVTLLALLKHPYARFGLDAGLVRRGARVLDLALLRGPRISAGSRGLKRRFEEVRDDVLRGTAKIPDVTGGEPAADKKARAHGRLHPTIARYSTNDWQAAEIVLKRLLLILEPLEAIFMEDGEISLSEIAQAHLQTLRASMDEHRINDAAIKALLAQFDALTGTDATSFLLEARDYPELFRALLGSMTVRETGAQDPRILILGALEARLLSPDFIVLAALDEGTWPKPAQTDAFLSRSMRANLGLEAPERRIGLAAHDICQGFGVRHVLLSRAAKRGGTPVVMSRWLQRLLAFVGEPLAKAMAQRGARHLIHANFLDQPGDMPLKSQRRPNPNPPVETRPRSLSVTQIETWVRDPYAIYASEILDIKRIDPLGALPGFAERGTIIHEALDRFNQGWNGVVNADAHARLRKIGVELFEREMRDFPDLKALWWPRFERIAEAYLNWEGSRDPVPLKRHSEVYARQQIMVDGEAFTLSGALDRIDELADNTVSILDFKTGTPPSAKQVKSGLNSQLALEVTLLQKGAFDFIKPFSHQSVSALGWVKLNGRSQRAEFQSALKNAGKGEHQDTPDDLGKLAEEQLIGLIRQYRNPKQGYMSRPRPDFKFRYEGDYDHLARVKEWQIADGEDDV